MFAKIIAGEIPAEKLYEDDICIAINDINPQAPVHILVIPKKPVAMLSEAEPEDQSMLGHLLLVARKLAHDSGIGAGFRIIINNGEKGGQTVFHLHVHLVGGFALSEGML